VLVFLGGEPVGEPCWPAERTFAANTRLFSITAQVSESLSAHTNTSGGSSDTLEKADTVMPCTRTPEREVTIVTPLAQRPSASRNSRAHGQARSSGARVYPRAGLGQSPRVFRIPAVSVPSLTV
jgi:hypothetical protein